MTEVYGPVGPGLDVSAYAHSVNPQPYDAEVWPYLVLAGQEASDADAQR